MAFRQAHLTPKPQKIKGFGVGYATQLYITSPHQVTGPSLASRCPPAPRLWGTYNKPRGRSPRRELLRPLGASPVLGHPWEGRPAIGIQLFWEFWETAQGFWRAMSMLIIKSVCMYIHVYICVYMYVYVWFDLICTWPGTTAILARSNRRWYHVQLLAKMASWTNLEVPMWLGGGSIQHMCKCYLGKQWLTIQVCLCVHL